jgi:hypothetical protein
LHEFLQSIFQGIPFSLVAAPASFEVTTSISSDAANGPSGSDSFQPSCPLYRTAKPVPVSRPPPLDRESLAKMKEARKIVANIVRQFMNHVVPGVIRPLRILWNEIIGFIFLVLAGWMVPGTIRSVRQLNSPDGSIFRVLMFIGFGVMLAYFGITSFLKARKISRS